jgi:phosphohistidine phosphatase
MSRELILVRHAIAFERNQRRWPDDKLRPLTPAGRAKFRRAATGLAQWLSRPNRLLTSPLVRARQTADVLRETARWPKAIEAPELAPGAGTSSALAMLRKQKATRIAVVGHEPDLSALLMACIAPGGAGVAITFKKGGVACVQFARDVRAGAGTLLAFIPPRALRRMRRKA